MTIYTLDHMHKITMVPIVILKMLYSLVSYLPVNALIRS